MADRRIIVQNDKEGTFIHGEMIIRFKVYLNDGRNELPFQEAADIVNKTLEPYKDLSPEVTTQIWAIKNTQI